MILLMEMSFAEQALLIIISHVCHFSSIFRLQKSSHINVNNVLS